MGTHPTKRKTVFAVVSSFILVCLLSASLLIGVSAGEDDGTSEISIDDKTLITYGYLQKYGEELKKEIIEALGGQGTNYKEVALKKGTVLSFTEETEIIFRSGSAIVLTASEEDGAGCYDLSNDKEVFAGEKLQAGHIYYKTKAEALCYIIITGEKAVFTIRGKYATN